MLNPPAVIVRFLCVILYGTAWLMCCNGNNTDDFLKCKFRNPPVTCDMFIGEFIVYDANLGRCMVQSNGCNADVLKAASFSTMQECEATCIQRRCSYRIPEILCLMYIGEHIVFDANQGKCTIQSGGCSFDAVKPYEFSSFQECEAACLGGGGVVRSTTPTTTVIATTREGFFATMTTLSTQQKCEYKIPKKLCRMYIGEHIVFDSEQNKCTIQSGGCSVDAVKPYEFASFEQCESACSPQQQRQKKCSYLMPVAAFCNTFIGRFIVYDKQQQRCGVQSYGCLASEVEPYAFSTMEECKRICG